MPSEITAEELSKLPTPDPIKSLSPEDKAAWDAYRKGELPKLKQELSRIDRPPTTEPESEEMPIDDLPPEANHDDDCPCRCCEAFRQELIESEQWEDDDED